MKTKLSFTKQLGQWLAAACLLALPAALPAGTNSLADALDTPDITWNSPPSNNAAPWFPENSTTHDGDAAAQSGTTASLATSPLDGSLVGPCIVTFWWKLSSSSGIDKLSVTVDKNNTAFELQGTHDWQFVTLPVSAAGAHTLHWRYFKIGSAISTDAGWLDQVSVTNYSLPQVDIQPASQSVSVGSNPSFFAYTISSSPATYQWTHAGTNLVGQTGQTLNLTNVGRRFRGNYAAAVTNSAGGILSANGTLQVPIAQDLVSTTLLPNGTRQLVFHDGDNVPLVAGDLPRFSGQVTTNLAPPNWTPIPGSLTLSNGNLIMIDPHPSDVRYYRIQEQY